MCVCVCVFSHVVPVGYPLIVESPLLKAVEKGRNAVMVCEAEGNPHPDVWWLKDNIPVNITDPRLQVLDSGNTCTCTIMFILILVYITVRNSSCY